MRITVGKAAVAAVLTLCVHSAADAETLLEIYRQALQNDHQFKAASAAYRAGLEAKNLGRAGLLPQIDGSYEWQDDDFDNVGTRDFETDDGVFLQGVPFDRETDTTTSGYTVSLTQPLFDLGAWHFFKRGKLDSRVAAADYSVAKQNLIIRTAEAYFDALRAIDNFETARAEENANFSQLEQTRKRFEVGLTAITDVHEAQAAYDNSRARRLLQEGNIGIRFEALEVITGQSYELLTPLKEDFPITPPAPAERVKWVEFSLENNFNLAAASLRAESARQAANEARAGHFPRLTGNVSYSDFNEDALLSDIDTDGRRIGVQLTIPIYSGGQVSASRRQAAERYLESRENYFQTQRDTVQRARSLHLTVVTDVATVQARKQAITSSQSALDATQAGYEVGTRDLVDVLIAQRTLFTAQRDYSDALYIYVLDTLLLKEVAGTLVEKDIAELDAWLDRTRQVSRYTDEIK